MPTNNGQSGERRRGEDGDGGSPTLGPTLRRSSKFGLNASAGASISSPINSMGAEAKFGRNTSYTDQEFQFDWQGDGRVDRVAPGEIFLTGLNRLVRLDIDCLVRNADGKCAQDPTVRESKTLTGGVGLNAGGLVSVTRQQLAAGRQSRPRQDVCVATASLATIKPHTPRPRQ